MSTETFLPATLLLPSKITLPNAICQAVTIQLNANGAASVTAAQVNNGSNDNCGIASLVLSQTDFDCTEVGDNTVTLTVTDVNGNVSSCDATVTVEDNVAPNAICQAVTIQLDANGAASVTAAQVNNGSNDNCGIASLVLSQTDFDCTEVGDNTVTLTVTDVNGNVSSCDATVTVEDNVAPNAICQAVTIQLDANGAASVTAAQVNNGSNDNCGIASLVLSQTDFDCTEVGDNTVTLTVTDVNGNVSSCDATVTVEDNVAPNAICQAVTIQLDANGAASVTAAQVNNGSNDNCGIASLVLSQTDFDCTEVGDNTVTLTVTDVNGNVSSCDATVTVEDNVAPNAICQAVTIQLDANGAASVTAAQVNNGSNDNCGIASLVLSQTDFDCTEVGDNTVTLTVTDVNGNVSSCDATVTVEDNVAPNAICQAVTIQLDANGAASVTAAQVNNGSNDNCGIASLVLSQTDFDCTEVGDNTVTLTVTDVNGNVSSCDATVTVEDNVAPNAICQAVTIQLDANGAASVTAAQVNNGSNDNCGIASLVLSQTDFDCTEVGDNTVTLTVTDVNGNVSSCDATVTVEDNVAPNAICQAVTIQLDANGAASVTAAQVNNGSNDNCGIASLVLSQTDFDCTEVGDNTVTLTVTDVNGNVSSCDATVTVEDNVAPNAICQAVTIQLDANGAASVTAAQVNNGSNDNCGIASLVLSQTDFDCTEVGDNTVTLTVTDVNGNVSSCDATVTVEDNVAPNAICQAVTIQLDANGAASVTAAQVNNGSNDNCGIASLVLSQTDFDCTEVGDNTVTLTVTDVNGNVSSCDATVTVEDNVAPNAICQAVTIQLDANGAASVTAAQVNNGSNDNCGIASLVLSQTDFDCTEVGDNTVTLTVTDVNGNVSSCDATVTVEDNVAPNAICQAVTIQLDANGAASVTAAQVNNGSNDNCGIASLVLSQTDFDCTEVGDNTVTLTVTDVNGNVSSCDATVTVEDNVAPNAICQAVTIQLDANGAASVTAAQVNNGSNDNCGIASLVLSQTDFDCTEVGDNTVTLTVTDVNGNVSSCDATVTVEDNVAPNAICQAVTIQLDANGAASVTAAQVNNGSNDNCGIASLVLSQTDFDCTEVGDNTVTLTVTDVNGNVSSCDATVTVEDNVAPNAICQAVTIQLDANGAASVTAAQVNNGSNDNCGIASLVLSQTDFDCTEVGDNTVTLTVTDVNGNVSSCDATVTVEDNVAPNAICQAVTIQLDANGAASVTAAQVNNGSNDNCGIASLVLSQTDFDCTEVGDNTVTLTVTDVNGNVSSCDATVTVEDNVAPNAICQAVTIQLDANGAASVTAAQVNNGSNDNCGIASLVLSQTDFDCTEVGDNTVTLTVTDVNGNVSSCDATVTVEDNVAPNAICQAVTIQLDANGAASVTAAQVNNGSNDNCGIASLVLSQTDFDCTEVGDNTVTLTVTDVNGNVSSCDATVTVEDNVAPNAICQAVTIQLDANGAASVTAAQVNNGSNDNCGIASLVLSQTDFDCTEVGDNTVTLTVTDVNGNVSSCDATVTVEDNVAPNAICQAVTIQLDANGAASVTAAQVNNGSNDNCGIASLVLSQTDFDCTEVGDNTVTLTVTDVNGNVSSCDATVTVEDNVAPNAICQAVTIQLDANGAASVTAAQVNNGSNDNCGIASLVLSQTDFDCTEVGDNTVTLTVTDVNGNVSSCDATVTVEDNVAPNAICQAVTIQLDANGAASVTAAQVNNGSNDNCGIASLVLSQTDFDCTEVGDNTVTLTVTDVNGNVSSCDATVTVEDNVAPNAICQAVTIQLDANGAASVTAAQVNNGSNDNCGIASLVLSQTDFDCTEVGDNTVTLTVTDVNGNVSSCDATVTVEDNVAPNAICQAVTIQLDANGAASVTAAQVNNGSNDNCGIASLTLSQTNFDCSEVGANTVTLTVEDVNGNTSTCTATVTVINDLPQITSEISGPIDPIQIGTSFNLSAEYDDVNLESAIWYFSSDGENFDEGSPGTIDFENMTITGTFELETNVYTVKLVITDVCGEQDEAYYQYVVIYDPDGGFITGGGWIWSPEGALTTDPLAEGKANFGFVAKYKPGKNTVGEVDGNTNFQFKKGDLHFKSSSHDDMSLVISGQKATYRGVGTVNGNGSHKFLVSAIDGDVNGGSDVDKFRIKIYADGSSSDVLYDNQMDASDNADATTILGGGSIVIHTKKNKSGFIEPEFEYVNLNVYPNPFTDRVQFEFVSPEPVNARIDVYDMTGRMVKTVFEGPVEGGVNYNAEFKPQSEISGFYLYRMTLGEAVYNGKLIYNKK